MCVCARTLRCGQRRVVTGSRTQRQQVCELHSCKADLIGGVDWAGLLKGVHAGCSLLARRNDNASKQLCRRSYRSCCVSDGALSRTCCSRNMGPLYSARCKNKHCRFRSSVCRHTAHGEARRSRALLPVMHTLSAGGSSLKHAAAAVAAAHTLARLSCVGRCTASRDRRRESAPLYAAVGHAGP